MSLSKACRSGLDTIIGERGFKISGGQRQRLAIARAFLKDSKIVILDEATSAVDSESENQIHEAMELLMDGRTVFLIAHRLRSAVTADLIVVMDRGRIVETGTHAELMRRGGAYAGLFNEQARGLRWNRRRATNRTHEWRQSEESDPGRTHTSRGSSARPVRECLDHVVIFNERLYARYSSPISIS